MEINVLSCLAYADKVTDDCWMLSMRGMVGQHAPILLLLLLLLLSILLLLLLPLLLLLLLRYINDTC